MAKAKYTATRPVEHDGKPYGEGDPITLADEHAAPLLERGAIVPAGKAPEKPAEPADDTEAGE